MTNAEFFSRFERGLIPEDARVFFAPGRVNLIGEHTDYNGGHVFPCALSMGTYCAIRLRTDRVVQLYSADFPEVGTVTADLDALSPIKGGCWANYPLGVLDALMRCGLELQCGFEMWVAGDIPAGAGLSSSASLELAAAIAICRTYGFERTLPQTAQLCREAENDFVGVNCGIMDQFASAMGKAGHAIFLDTASLEYEYAPVAAKGCSLVIMDTRSPRTLAGSAYNDRRCECDEALRILRGARDIKSLGELTNAEFDSLAQLLTDDALYRRARHAVYENSRTVEAVRCLNAGDLAAFGRLMNLSHLSLRDDYEVTGPALDAIVEAAWAQEGVIGARMTGAGFGGCAVALVKTAQLEAFTAGVAELYCRATGLEPRFYPAEAADGPRELI